MQKQLLLLHSTSEPIRQKKQRIYLTFNRLLQYT